MPADTCGRCGGSGEVVYTFRRPGETEWTVGKAKPCPVCLGMGTRPPKRGGGWPDGSIHFHVKGGPNRMAMDEIMDRIEGKEPK